jgi:hypothetical protein
MNQADELPPYNRVLNSLQSADHTAVGWFEYERAMKEIMEIMESEKARASKEGYEKGLKEGAKRA